MVRKKVYLKAPAVTPEEYGEVEIIGEPRLFFLRPQRCSPDFSVSEGEYLTAQHCVGIGTDNRQVMMSDGLPARVVKTNPWRPLTWRNFVLCAIEYLLTKKWNCINVDWALIDRGNTHNIAPIGTLSGGTVPPGITFFAPYVSNPKEWVGKEVCGVSYDYDAQKHVLGTWRIVDLGVVKYEIEGKAYLVLAWFARGFSKPGFSGTCIYPANSCPKVVETVIELRDTVPVHNIF